MVYVHLYLVRFVIAMLSYALPKIESCKYLFRIQLLSNVSVSDADGDDFEEILEHLIMLYGRPHCPWKTRPDTHVDVTSGSNITLGDIYLSILLYRRGLNPDQPSLETANTRERSYFLTMLVIFAYVLKSYMYTRRIVIDIFGIFKFTRRPIYF